MQKGESRKISGDMIISGTYGQIFPQVWPRRKDIARQQQKNTSSFFFFQKTSMKKSKERNFKENLIQGTEEISPQRFINKIHPINRNSQLKRKIIKAHRE